MTNTEPTKGQNLARLKIVVATNFSQKSAMALDFALIYSQTFNADVYMFHVVDSRNSSDFRLADKQNEELMKQMKDVVTAAIERLHQQGIVPSVERVHRRLSHGKLATEVLRIVAGVNADMIVMGHPTANEFKKLVMKSPCSMVLVKEKDPEFVV